MSRHHAPVAGFRPHHGGELTHAEREREYLRAKEERRRRPQYRPGRCARCRGATYRSFLDANDGVCGVCLTDSRKPIEPACPNWREGHRL